MWNGILILLFGNNFVGTVLRFIDKFMKERKIWRSLINHFDFWMHRGYVKVNIVKGISEILNTIINHDTIIMEDLSVNKILLKVFTCRGVSFILWISLKESPLKEYHKKFNLYLNSLFS